MSGESSTRPRFSLGLVGVGVIAISFAAPLFKLSAPTHPLIAAATRLSIAMVLWGVIMLGLRLSRGDPLKIDRDQARVAALCGLCYAVHFGAWVWSLGLTSVITSATLVTTTPLMLGVIGIISGRDRPTRRLIISGAIAALGVAGFALEATHNPRDSLIGDALALLGAVAMVPYLLMTRRLASRLSLAPFSCIATGVGAVVLWLGAALSLPSSDLSLPIGQPLWALVGAALIPQLIGHSSLTLSLRHLTPTEVGIATLLEPLGAALLAWWWMSESPSALTASASAITLIGVGVALLRRSPST